MPVPSPIKTTKIIELEALRGIAAIVVLFDHFMMAFAPRVDGLLYPDQSGTIFGTPVFALVNGSAAVAIFFLLSGFVLTLKVFQTESVKSIPAMMLKRWPRLVVAVLVVNLLSGLLVAAHFYRNTEAAALVQSAWLGDVFNWPSSGFSEILKAGGEALVVFFRAHAPSYNGNLWTMFYEFWGSLIALSCAFAVQMCRAAFARHAVFMVFLLSSTILSPHFGTFIAGVWLAYYFAKTPNGVWPKWLIFPMVLALFLIFGLHENMTSHRFEGWYAFLNVFGHPFFLRVVLHTCGGIIAMFAFLRLASIKTTLSGKFGGLLGYLSFPIYLVQMPVICSLTSYVYVQMPEASPAARFVLCFAVTMLATFLLAVPVARLDRWWVQALNRIRHASSLNQVMRHAGSFCLTILNRRRAASAG